MNLLQYAEVDLPTFAEEEVAWTTNDIRQAALSKLDGFVRRACLRYEGPERNLSTVLRLGDQVLTHVCEVMRVSQVKHTWGLAPLSEANRVLLRSHSDPTTYDNGITSYHGDLDNSLIPKGYGLVAAVETVAGARPLDYFQRDEIGRPNYIGVEVNGYRVTNEDLRAEQFVSDPTGRIVLVDPEPRLHLTPATGGR